MTVFAAPAMATTCGSMSASSWASTTMSDEAPCEGMAEGEVVSPSELASPEAATLQHQGRFAEAVKAYEQFAMAEPAHPEAPRARLWAAHLRRRLGLPLEVEGLTKTLWPTHRRALATLFASWGEEALRRGKHRSALAYARRARGSAGSRIDVVIRAMATETAAMRATGRMPMAIAMWKQMVAHWTMGRAGLERGGGGRDSKLEQCRFHRAACAVAEAEIGLGDVHAQRARQMMRIAGRGRTPSPQLAERAILEFQRAERHYANTLWVDTTACVEPVIRASERAGRLWRDAQAMFNRMFPRVATPFVVPLCGDPFEPAIRRAYTVCIAMSAATKRLPDLMTRCEAGLEYRAPWPAFERGLTNDLLRSAPTRPVPAVPLLGKPPSPRTRAPIGRLERSREGSQ